MKNCPFCSAEPGEDGPVEWGDGKCYYVKCRNCGARGPTWYTADATVIMWDRRPGG